MKQHKEIELSILGTLTINSDVYPWISDMIHPDIFNVFREEMNFIIDRLDAGKSFDKVSVINFMLEKHKGVTANSIKMAFPYLGAELERNEIATIVNEAISLATDEETIIQHCHVLIDAYKSENIRKEANDLVSRLHEGEQPDKSLSTFTGNVEMLNNNFQTWTDRTMTEAEVMFKELEKIGKGEITGVPTPWQDVTAFTGGWQGGDFIVVGARPKMGKSTFMIQNVLSAAEAGKRAAVISLGDSPVKKLTFKACSMYTGIGQADIRKNGYTAEYRKEFTKAKDWFKSLPVNFLDNKDVRRDITSIKNKIRRLVEVDGAKIIFIDYLQLIRGSRLGENRNLEIGFITEDIKDLAVTLDVPIITPAQLNRDVEKRGGMKKPYLSDLRDSGTIEQAADHINFLWRPGYYEIYEDEEGNSLKGVTDILWRAYREAGELVPRDFRLYFRNQKLHETEDDPFEGIA